MTVSKKKTTSKPKERKLTLKEQGFIKDIVRTKNATESAMLNYSVKNRDVARSIGSQNLSKLHIRKEIVEAFKHKGLEVEQVIDIHKRNILQDKHLGVSQSAVVDYYELTGIKRKEVENNSTNIQFVINT